jgi:flagellar biosynthesis/type III secretory pathway M-ring protein FliF/YscJ
MPVVVAIVVFVLLFVVLFVISAPLRAGGSARQDDRSVPVEQADLDAAREAKYREIRDAELDFRTGKLSDEDYAATDGALRAEAVEILDRIEAIDEPAAGAGARDDDGAQDPHASGDDRKPNPKVED